MQTCDFPFEILIGEDDSTDGTREICLDYSRRHPDRIRVSLRSRPEAVFIDGLSGGSRNFIMTLREACGEFVALCEGDDFWTDPSKLQRQVDFLRANPDCVGCFHDSQQVDGEGRCLRESYFQAEEDRFSQADVLEKLLSRQPTCSMVYRASALAEPLPEWYLRRPSDLYLDILLTSHGSLGFVRHNMAAYRKHTGGIWSSQRESNQIIELIIRFKLLLADNFFLENYRDLLLRKIDELQASLFTRKDFAGEIDRLEGVVQEQTKAIESTQTERTRLSAVAKKAEAEAKRAAKAAQKHIDALSGQLAQLAGTSREQATYIGVLEGERNRLSEELSEARVESKRQISVIDEQLSYIKILELERGQAKPSV